MPMNRSSAARCGVPAVRARAKSETWSIWRFVGLLTYLRATPVLPLFCQPHCPPCWPGASRPRHSPRAGTTSPVSRTPLPSATARRAFARPRSPRSKPTARPSSACRPQAAAPLLQPGRPASHAGTHTQGAAGHGDARAHRLRALPLPHSHRRQRRHAAAPPGRRMGRERLRPWADAHPLEHNRHMSTVVRDANAAAGYERWEVVNP